MAVFYIARRAQPRRIAHSQHTQEERQRSERSCVNQRGVSIVEYGPARGAQR
jgi:hypothetical protein